MSKDGKKPTPGTGKTRTKTEDSIPELDLSAMAADQPAPKREPEKRPSATRPAQPRSAGPIPKGPASPPPGSRSIPLGSVQLEDQPIGSTSRSFSGEDLKPMKTYEMAPRPSIPLWKLVKITVGLGLAVAVYLELQQSGFHFDSSLLKLPSQVQVIREPRAKADMPMGIFRLHLNPQPDAQTEIRIEDQHLDVSEDIRFSMLFNKGTMLTISRPGYQPFSQKLFYTGYPKGSTSDIPVDVDLTPEHYGTLVLTASVPAAAVIEASTGKWTKNTPVYDLRLPPADYTVHFVKQNDSKEVVQSVTIREGSLAQISEGFAEPTPLPSK